ncbi:MAG: radical SAM protein [Pseudomonadota bacterium]
MSLADNMKLSLEIGRSAWIRRRPFLVYFKPTPRCDLRCEICSRWKQKPDPGRELPLDKIKPMLEKIRRAGGAVLTLWGGEPMLRKDLPQILGAAKGLGYRTSICTNCNRLERRAGEVLPHLDVLLCSLDGYGEVHDRLRGVKGLFERAVRGIRLAREQRGLTIKIWATVHRKNMDQVEKLARLAQDLGVGIEFFPVSAIAGYNDGILPGREELKQAFEKIMELKRSGMPVRNPDRVLRIMRDKAPFTCNFGATAIHIDHAGRVYTCENAAGEPLHAWGKYDTFDPESVFASDGFRAVASRLRKCNLCRLPCVLELSGSLPYALAEMFFKFNRSAGL